MRSGETEHRSRGGARAAHDIRTAALRRECSDDRSRRCSPSRRRRRDADGLRRPSRARSPRSRSHRDCRRRSASRRARSHPRALPGQLARPIEEASSPLGWRTSVGLTRNRLPATLELAYRCSAPLSHELRPPCRPSVARSSSARWAPLATRSRAAGLIDAGMDVAGFNSRTEPTRSTAPVSRVCAGVRRERKSVAVLQDLCGPKIRTGTFPAKFDLPSGVRGHAHGGREPRRRAHHTHPIRGPRGRRAIGRSHHVRRWAPRPHGHSRSRANA